MLDPKIKNLIASERARQGMTIDLIASENFVSQDVLTALGSIFTNKYSEGYPGKRYYPGNEFCDRTEELAREYALETFGLAFDRWGVNVQAYSGSPANMAAYAGVMEPGDLILGMKLSSGGHLTHGHNVSMTGKFFRSVQYQADEKGYIDYDEVYRLAKENKPKVIVSGTTAYPRKIDFKKFGEIAKEVGAIHMSDISHIAGLVIAGVHPSPFKHAEIVTTTTHKTLRGPRGALIFSRKDITMVNGKTISEGIDKAIFPGLQGGPHNNQTLAIVQALYEAMKPSYQKYAEKVAENAKVLSEELIGRGFTLVTGGTDNHLMVVDLRPKEIEGSVAEKNLEKNGIIANRNTVPGDISAFKPSGIRIGTPAVTTRGMGKKEMKKIAELIERALLEEDVLREVLALTKRFPLKYSNK